MPKIFDLLGQRFGRLTVMEKLGSQETPYGRRKVIWSCRCDCGTVTTASSNDLRTSRTRSCGCLMRETSARIAKEHPAPSTALDLAHQRFGLLTALRPTDERVQSSVVWECSCECGGSRKVATPYLTSGAVTNCGCLRGEAFVTHGDTRKHQWSSEYGIWSGMVSRCHNPKHRRFSDYGGRGIKVCERWRSSYENFLADMGRKPSPKHTIDRRDNDGNYEPGNCRWATRVEQGRNRSNNHMLTWRGETLCIAEWAERTGLPPRRIASRISRGWSTDRALGTPV